MRGRLSQVLAAIAGVLLVPVLASAQASIAGVVRDASNAVMPGVTIEVTSPALIEKVRTGVTDGAGQYQITSLPPGLYTVTFTLASFNTVRREGIELTGSFAAKVDAELRVGALEETVTVTGRSPVVDVQSATRQTVMGREVIDTIPAGRNPNMLGVLIPGITTNNPIQDVGGAESRGGTQPGNTALAIHGGRTGDQIYMQNGVSAVSFDGAFINPLIPNPGGTQEIVLDTAASSVEHYAGGVRINIIPRDGGNLWTGTFFGTFANNSFQSSNVDDDLRAVGVTGGEAIKLLMDINPGGGGPIRRDKLWFFGSARFNRADSYAANAFYNLNANKPNEWTYAKDSTRQPSNDVEIKDAQVRLTWQATASNKIGIVLHEQVNCYCPAVVSALNSFETHSHKALPVERSYALDWTMPATNRFLVEAGAFYYKGTTNWNPWPGLAPGMISVVEQSTGVNYRSGDAAGERRYGSGPMYGLHSRVAASYITGTHAFKVGFNDTSGTQSFSNMVLMPLKYRFNNGVPNRITEYAYGGDNDPLISKSTIDFNLGVFAQDKWTVKRLTTTYGVRLDWFKSSFPEQTVTPSLYAPTRNIVFPAQDNTSWKDVTPRFSAIYDLFGTGKTGIKMSLSKYLENMGTSQDMVAGPNPTRTLVTSAFRSWTDQNGNFVPDCNLLNAASQDNRSTGGDLCGALSDSNFGSVRPGAVYDPELLSGWGKRGYNWELGVGVQHELVSRVALDVSYFRRWYGNFRITDNRAVSESDYDTFAVTAPVDPRLPGGGGYVIPNAQDLKPASFGRPAQLFTTLADPYGKQSEYWQGLDVTINARPGERVLLQGGVSGGRTVIDGCDVLQKVPEAKLDVYCRTVTSWSGGTQVKFLGSYTIPKIETRVSATYQDIPGAQISAIYNVPTAVAATTLGRPLSGGAANLPLNLVAPGTMYGDRIHQVDMRFGKIIRYARTRITLNVDLYNAFNANPVLTQNANYDSWLLPTNILQARFLKLGLQLDF